MITPYNHHLPVSNILCHGGSILIKIKGVYIPILSKCHFKILVYSSCKNNQETTQINPCIPSTSQNIPCHSNFANALSTFYYCLETQLDTLHLSLPLEWGIHKKTDSIIVSHISGENPKVDKAIVVKKTHNINIFIKKFLFERISLAIQRGNAASIRGTFPDSAILSEIFVL
jgi:hypothetical protein